MVSRRLLSSTVTAARASPDQILSTRGTPKRSVLGRVPRCTDATARGGHRRELPDSPCYHFGIGIIIRVYIYTSKVSQRQLKASPQSFSQFAGSVLLSTAHAASTLPRRLELFWSSSTPDRNMKGTRLRHRHKLVLFLSQCQAFRCLPEQHDFRLLEVSTRILTRFSRVQRWPLGNTYLHQ